MKFVELPEKIERNLVVIAPTGSGKTTAVLKNLDSYKLQFKRIFLTFPTKTLMAKKLPESSFLLDNSDVRLRKHIDISNWFTKITGDTDPLVESMKNIAFFVNRVVYVFNYGSDDWWILGKTMKQIRSMIYNNVPIKDVLNSYIDGTIDKFFDVVSLWKP